MNTSITSLGLLAETVELECKLAAGKSGRGELPKDFWPTYSAFANTHGGVVLLGIKEKPRGCFSAFGIEDADKVITDLFNQLNNPKKVNINLLSDNDVEKLSVVKRKMLAMQGYGRGAVYHLHGTSLPTPDQVFGEAPSGHDKALTYSGGSASYSGGSEDVAGAEPQSLDAKKRLVSPELNAPAIHDLATLEPSFLTELKEQARLAREKKRLSAATMQRLILQLCTGQFITRACLAELLKRNADTLRKEYLNPLVEDKLIALAFPQTPNDKRQAYITTEKGRSWLAEHNDA